VISEGRRSGGELDSGETGVEELREFLDGSGLGETGKPFEEEISVGEEADEQPLDHVILAENGLSYLFLQFQERIACGHGNSPG